MDSCKTLTYAVTVLSCSRHDLQSKYKYIIICKIRLRMLGKADPLFAQKMWQFSPFFVEEKRDKVKAEPREPREPPNEAQVPLFQLHPFCRDLDGYDKGH